MDTLRSIYFFKCCYSRTFEKNMNTLFTLQNDLSLLLFEIKTSTSCMTHSRTNFRNLLFSIHYSHKINSNVI